MRAVTLYQPYAQLIAWGEKRVETRGWKANHRGLLAIHAGADRRYSEQALQVPEIMRAFVDRSVRPDHLPYGAVVAVARVIDCVPAEDVYTALLRAGFQECIQPEFSMRNERAMGDLSPGRFGWILDDVQVLHDPVPASGRQMLWTLPEDVELAVLRQIVGV